MTDRPKADQSLRKFLARAHAEAVVPVIAAKSGVPVPTVDWRPLIERVPKVGDPVWFATKEVEGVVTSVGTEGYSFESGGPAVSPSGRPAARRYRTVAHLKDAKWDEHLYCWIVGTGRLPYRRRAGLTVLRPAPLTAGARIIN